MLETNTILNLKANQNTTYTKTEINNIHNDDHYTITLIFDHFYSKGTVDNLVSASYSTTQINVFLNLKANLSLTYNRSQIDTWLSLKSDITITYNKTEVDDFLNLKANQGSIYSKIEVDDIANLKANLSTTYTMLETNT